MPLGNEDDLDVDAAVEEVGGGGPINSEPIANIDYNTTILSGGGAYQAPPVRFRVPKDQLLSFPDGKQVLKAAEDHIRALATGDLSDPIRLKLLQRATKGLFAIRLTFMPPEALDEELSESIGKSRHQSPDMLETHNSRIARESRKEMQQMVEGAMAALSEQNRSRAGATAIDAVRAQAELLRDLADAKGKVDSAHVAELERLLEIAKAATGEKLPGDGAKEIKVSSLGLHGGTP